MKLVKGSEGPNFMSKNVFGKNPKLLPPSIRYKVQATVLAKSELDGLDNEDIAQWLNTKTEWSNPDGTPFTKTTVANHKNRAKGRRQVGDSNFMREWEKIIKERKKLAQESLDTKPGGASGLEPTDKMVPFMEILEDVCTHLEQKEIEELLLLVSQGKLNYKTASKMIYKGGVAYSS